MCGRGFKATDQRDKVYSVLGLGRVDIGTTAQAAQTEPDLDNVMIGGRLLEYCVRSVPTGG